MLSEVPMKLSFSCKLHKKYFILYIQVFCASCSKNNLIKCFFYMMTVA